MKTFDICFSKVGTAIIEAESYEEACEIAQKISEGDESEIQWCSELEYTIETMEGNL